MEGHGGGGEMFDVPVVPNALTSQWAILLFCRIVLNVHTKTHA